MKRLVLMIAVTAALMSAAPAAADWSVPVGSNVVADQVIPGGGYPVPPGATSPTPAPAGPGSTTPTAPSPGSPSSPARSRSSATSKLFFENFSTFYDFHLGAYAIHERRGHRRRARCRATTASRPARRRCRRAGRTTPIRTSTSTRRGAPTRRRCRSTPSGRAACTRTARSTSPTPTTSACTGSKGNGGRDLEPNNNQTSLSFGHVEDKQWVAVNHFPGTAYQDHVYAMWTTFNGAAGNGKIRLAVSRDRGQTFSKAITITPPGTTTPATTYVYPVRRRRTARSTSPSSAASTRRTRTVSATST